MENISLSEQLTMYEASMWPVENDATSALKRFINSTSTPYDRQRVDGCQNIVVSFMVINASGNKTLMQYHKKLKLWLQFGGHADGNSNLLEVGATELEEETGLTAFKVIDISFPSPSQTDAPSIFSIAQHHHTADKLGYEHDMFDIVYLVQVPEDANPQIIEPDKCGELRWVNAPEAKQLAGDNTAMHHLVNKWAHFFPQANR